MLSKNPSSNEVVEAEIVPLRRDAEPRARNQPTPAPNGSRKEQLRRQRERIQEYLETIEQLTLERDQAREQVTALGDLADRMLTNAEVAQNRVLELEAQVVALQAENDALLSQGFAQAERLELVETRLRVLLAD